MTRTRSPGRLRTLLGDCVAAAIAATAAGLSGTATAADPLLSQGEAGAALAPDPR